MTKHIFNTPTHKRCPRCEILKLRSEFYRNRGAHDGLGTYCKPCSIVSVREYHQKDPKRHSEYNKHWDRRNPERKKDRALKTRLGVPYGTYQTMLAAQDGKCAICATTIAGGKSERFHVDHCGDTQVIRGLLCSCCNTGLGQFQHNEGFLQAAIAYLKNYPGQPKVAEKADVDSMRMKND